MTERSGRSQRPKRIVNRKRRLDVRNPYSIPPVEAERPEDAVDHTSVAGREVAVDGEVEAVLFDLDLNMDDIVDDEREGEPLAADEPGVRAVPGADGRAAELRPERADTNMRLDKYVARELGDLSRSYFQQLIDDGFVRVDGQIRRPSFKVTPGEVVTVAVPAPVEDDLQPEPIPLDIVFENDDVIVINKPAGLVVHPAPGHATGTLVNGLIYYAPELSVGGSHRPGIVHRLDKDTSGLIVVAKNDQARNSLVAQWETRTVKKRYIALLHGLLVDDDVTIDAPIGRDPMQRQRMAVVPSGRRAVTHLYVVERLEHANATLVDATIETGPHAPDSRSRRVHQASGHRRRGLWPAAGRRQAARQPGASAVPARVPSVL